MSTEDLPTFVDVINALATANDWTQSGTARALGVSQPQLSKWQTGRSEPKLSTFIALVKRYPAFKRVLP